VQRNPNLPNVNGRTDIYRFNTNTSGIDDFISVTADENATTEGHHPHRPRRRSEAFLAPADRAAAIKGRRALACSVPRATLLR